MPDSLCALDLFAPGIAILSIATNGGTLTEQTG